MDQNVNESTASVTREMPRYKCHKEVWALKIAMVEHHDDGALITPAEEGYAPFEVNSAFVVKHGPEIGGYYVVYDDEYRSYSPAAPFESGYALIEPPAPSNLQPHQQRVMDEREELHARLGKLRGFIGTEPFNALEVGERDRLERQEHHMSRYLHVLDERTTHFPLA